jgi:hypothetical protein
MKKKKILFYGNCQFGALASIFSLSPNFKEKYEIIQPSKYNLPFSFGNVDNAVGNFLLGLNTKQPSEHLKPEERKTQAKLLTKAISDADILIFQSLAKMSHREDEITTDYIYENFVGEKLCLPSFWFTGYLVFPFIGSQMLDVFCWLILNNIKNPADFLTNESYKPFENLVEHYTKLSIEGLRNREGGNAKNYNFCKMEDTIISNYKTKLLCFNHSHPTTSYFNLLFKKAIKKLNMDDLDFTPQEKSYDIAGADGYYFPDQFKFFRDVFPEMEDLKKHEHKYNKETFDDFVSRNISAATDYLNHKRGSNNNVEKGIEILNNKEL